MIRHALFFAGAFVLGTILATTARVWLHDPHRDPHPPLAPPHTASPAAAAAPAPSGAAIRGMPSAPVNTTCAVCGMPVDPSIPTATYRGQSIGFGCRACPAKFAADPERYGPAALENRTAQE